MIYSNIWICSFYFLYENFPRKNLNLALKYITIFIAIHYDITYNNVPYFLYYLYTFIYVQNIFSNDILFVCCAFLY